jgi:ferrochelatase
MARLAAAGRTPHHVICYQSRVGPLQWLEPSTADEVVRAGRDGVAVIMVPIAFVSEHSETLVELDIEYGELAERGGVVAYIRVPTVSTAASFIDGLAVVVQNALALPAGWDHSGCGGGRLCPAAFGQCVGKMQ